MFRLFECCALSFFERFVLSFSLKIERFVSDSAEIWICGLYIRPQENGTKTDIRWWKMLDQSGNGIKIVAAAPFSASALHYTIESLDEGWSKEQGHSQEVDEADLTNLCIDKVQAGLGCEDSWGRIARPEYLVPYADYEFTFILFPVCHSIGIE